jgi:hypothetical protein
MLDEVLEVFEQLDRLALGHRRDVIEELSQRASMLEVIEEGRTGTRVPVNTGAPPRTSRFTITPGSCCTLLSATLRL